MAISTECESCGTAPAVTELAAWPLCQACYDEAQAGIEAWKRGERCAMEGCDEPASHSCDACDRKVCDEHITKFRGSWHGDTDQCEACLDRAAKAVGY